MKLSEMPNIGKELEKKLISAGIDTPEKLRETGSLETLECIQKHLVTGV